MWLEIFVALVVALKECHGEQTCTPESINITLKWQHESLKLITSLIAVQQHEFAETEFWQLDQPWKLLDEVFRISLTNKRRFSGNITEVDIKRNVIGFVIHLLDGKHIAKCNGAESIFPVVWSHAFDPRFLNQLTKMSDSLRNSCYIDTHELLLNNTLPELVSEIQSCNFKNTLVAIGNKSDDAYLTFYRQLINKSFHKNISNFGCIAQLNVYLQDPAVHLRYADKYGAELCQLSPVEKTGLGSWHQVAIGWHTLLQNVAKLGWGDGESKVAGEKLAYAIWEDMENFGETIVNAKALDIYSKVKSGLPQDLVALIWGQNCTIQHQLSGTYLAAGLEKNKTEMHEGSVEALGLRGHWELVPHRWENHIRSKAHKFFIRNLDWKREPRYLCVVNPTKEEWKKHKLNLRVDAIVRLCVKTRHGSDSITEWYIVPRKERQGPAEFGLMAWGTHRLLLVGDQHKHEPKGIWQSIPKKSTSRYDKLVNETTWTINCE